MLRGLRLSLILTPCLLLADYYLFAKLYRALGPLVPWPPELLRLGLMAAVAYLNLNPILILLLFGVGLRKVSVKLLEGRKVWDVLFGWPFWIGLVLAAELLPWMLAIDFLKLPFYPLYQQFRESWLEIEARVVVVVFALQSVFVLTRAVWDTIRIRVSRTVLTYRNLPLSLDGLKLVHISDIQADGRTGKMRLRRFAKKIQRLMPDLVFFSGDLVTAETRLLDFTARTLGELEAKYGTFACLGDHDVWTDKARISESLRMHGVVVLDDANRFVRVGNESVLVTFVTNVYAQRPSLDRINFLMGQQPRGVLDILLTHQPGESLVELAAERGYHLFLAGHTHGGQIVFNWFGLTVAAPRIESPYFRGRTHVGRMLVSVNSGLGFTLAPIRYNAPAEISVIEIVRQPG